MLSNLLFFIISIDNLFKKLFFIGNNKSLVCYLRKKCRKKVKFSCCFVDIIKKMKL